MKQPENQLFDRLGKRGLVRVLHDLLDQKKLVRLANSAGLRYPGMRTRSQKRERILADLVDRAGQEEATRKAVYRTLQKETGAASRSWSRLTEEQKIGRLKDLGADPGANGKLGLHLFLLAREEPGTPLEQGFRGLLAHSDLASAPERPPDEELAKIKRENTRVKKKLSEQRKKTAHLEGQLTKSRETAKTVKRDLIQRKGELAESRLLVERLRKQLAAAQGAARRASAKPADSAGEDGVEKLGKALRKLASEQRKLVHGIEKLIEARSRPPLSADALEPVVEAVQSIQKEAAGLRRDHRKETRDHGARLEELRTEVCSYKSAVSKRTGGALSPRRKGEPERVGVFVDVQNMYYGARQLKGKLDFDALLQAAVLDRRMIQAKAYVVESKEIDQSGFISRLRQRAIEVATKPLKVRADGSMKGNWDMEMALDILDAAPKLDVVVLVSGDGDFTSMVNRIKRMGPRVEVIGWPRTTAKSLMEAADRFQPLDRQFMIRTEKKD